MTTKSLLNPKVFINELSSHKIDALPIIYLIVTIILTLILLIFSSVTQDLIEVIKTTLAPINQLSGPARLSAILSISRDMLALLLFYLIIYVVILVVANLLVKLALKLFKKKVSLYKLLNISFYVILINRVLILIYSLIIIALSSLLQNIQESLATLLVAFPLIAISLATLILYIYGVAIITKNNIVRN